jgi:DNA (cytosine-5)-methyltransferase 1
MNDSIFKKRVMEIASKKKLSIKQIILKRKSILSSSNGFADEILDAIPNNTPSRQRMATTNTDGKFKNNKDLLKMKKEFFNTLTTKQDRHPNIGMIKYDPNIFSKEEIKGKLHERFITPREGYLIMGFTNKDFNSVKEMYVDKIITKSSMYKQAGNSICVVAIESIFEFISKLDKRIYD